MTVTDEKESTDVELARLKREIDEEARRPERQLPFLVALRMAERIALLERRRAEGVT